MPDWRSVAQPPGGERSTAPVCRSSSFTGFSAVFAGRVANYRMIHLCLFGEGLIHGFGAGGSALQEKSHKLLTCGTQKWGDAPISRFPNLLGGKIDRLVGKGGRSEFLTQAAEKELRRLQQIKGLEGAAGAWKDKNHPELRGGAAQWVRKPRKEK